MSLMSPASAGGFFTTSAIIYYMDKAPIIYYMLRSRFSHVRLCANPETAAHQALPFPGILQARTLEWVAISLSNA